MNEKENESKKDRNNLKTLVLPTLDEITLGKWRK